MAKVLFIEDNLGWQDTMQRLLNTAGHESCSATSFDIAISLLRGKEHFDLIVFDLRLSEEDKNFSSFVWLDALIQGMKARKLYVPPILIVTGLDITKKDVVRIFTEYRDYVYGYFEKKDFNPKDFMQSLKFVTSPSIGTSQNKGKPFTMILTYTLLMTGIMVITFSILVKIIGQVPDPQVQQTILQVGGMVIVAIAIFVTIFTQNTKLENVIEWIAKILRG